MRSERQKQQERKAAVRAQEVSERNWLGNVTRVTENEPSGLSLSELRALLVVLLGYLALAPNEAYVRQRGFILHKEYIDTVTGDFDKRKNKRKKHDLAYQELMGDVSKRLVDCVVVWKYDRFARFLSVLLSALEHFRSLGVDFISYTQQIDTTTPMGRLFFSVIGSFAEFEREMIVDRVFWSAKFTTSLRKSTGRLICTTASLKSTLSRMTQNDPGHDSGGAAVPG